MSPEASRSASFSDGEIEIRQDAGKRVIDLVGNAGCEHANGCHPVGDKELRLRRLFARDVSKDGDSSASDALAVTPGAPGRAQPSTIRRVLVPDEQLDPVDRLVPHRTHERQTL